MVQTAKTTDEQIEEMILKGEQEILAGIRAIEGYRIAYKSRKWNSRLGKQ